MSPTWSERPDASVTGGWAAITFIGEGRAGNSGERRPVSREAGWPQSMSTARAAAAPIAKARPQRRDRVGLRAAMTLRVLRNRRFRKDSCISISS
jgi:hypothetical protein